MIILISPSKTLDITTPIEQNIEQTQPKLLEMTKDLANIMRNKSAEDIKTLMKVSDKIAQLNYERFQSFETPLTSENSRPAIFSFKGDVYDGLNIDKFSNNEILKAQKHLRILSGFYGLLKPLDLMQPYRLEMGIKLANDSGKNLYEFWGDKITDSLNKELADSGSNVVINLASNEYFKAINTKKLKGKIITPTFKEIKGNELKIIGLFAKRARGMMARHLLTSDMNIDTFNEANYRFDATLSKSDERVFTRAA